MKLKLLFFLYFFIKSFYSKYLVYPFIQNKYDNLTEPSQIVSELLCLEYVTNITIGEPTQTIRSFIDFTKFHFYISNVSSNREYLLENSHTFSTIYEHDIILYTYSFVYGKYANDTLTIDLRDLNSSSSQNYIQIKDFLFSMPSEYTLKNRKMFPSSIGLGFYAYNSNSELNFLTQLNIKEILNNTHFFFEFDDDFSGKLYFGIMPHELYPKRYFNDNLYKVYTNINNYLDEWSFKVDFLYNYNENENNLNASINKKNMKVVLDLNLNGIIMDYSYFPIFSQTFFHEYINNGICKMKLGEYHYIYCEKDKININNFKTIFLYQKDFNFTFKFDYNDLFIIKHNYYIFNIFFDVNGFTHLLNAGKIFLRKYLLAFDYEQKMIGFYLEKPENKGLNLEDNNKNKNNQLIIIICFLIFVCIVLVFLIAIFIKYCCGNKGRKVRKNEIDESYDYSIQNND